MSEEWAVIITLIDGKAPNIVDTTLRFNSQTLAVRAVKKINDGMKQKNVRNVQVIGPFELSD